VADPHNFLLEIWATAGTPAMLAFLAVLGGFAWASMRGKAKVVGQVGNLPESGLTTSAPSEIDNSTLDKESSPPLYVAAGGVCGFLMAAPLGLLSAAPPGVASLLLGLPLAVATLALLWRWIEHGRLPRWLPALGVVTMLVDLLATGGIGFPGVAGSLWLLMALGLQGERPRELRPAVAWVALAVAMGLAVVCYRSAYSPVLGCQAQLRLAERKPAEAVEHLETAAAIDPWASEPWKQLAAVELERWWQQPNAVDFVSFVAAQVNALELAPNSASLCLTAGDWSMRAFSKTDERGKPLAPTSIGRALYAYDRAVQLYPNSAIYRAKLANAYQVVGDEASFRREAETALRLDDLTPYNDKKLPDKVRDRLLTDLRKNP
jgi:hypothetical protein